MKINLKETNILKVEIHDSEDKPTGEYLEFDLEDIELPLKYERIIEEDKKNRQWVKNVLFAIDKKQDSKSSKFFSKNDEEKLKAINEFYKREMKTLDLFLGENGCKKLLNGRKPYLEMFNDILEIIQPIIEELDIRATNIESKIKSKYGSFVENKNVIQ